MKYTRRFEEASDVFVEKNAYVVVEVKDTAGPHPDDDIYVRVLLAFDPDQLRDPMGILVASGPADGYEFADWVAGPEVEELGFRHCREDEVPALVIEP